MDQEKKNIPNEFSPAMAFIVILLALVCWMNIGPLLSLTLTMIPVLGNDQLIGLTEFMFRHIPYILMFLALAFGSRFLLKTKMTELISGAYEKPDLKIALSSFILYMAMLVLFSAISAKSIHIDSSPVKQKALFIIPVLVCTPMQVIAEELFFRALPARLVYHNRLPETALEGIPITLVSGLLFTIPHLGNPEVTSTSDGKIAIIYYFLWGMGAMALALYTKGFEMPIAMHLANNIYCALIVNYANSAMPTKAIFINERPSSSIVLLFQAIVIYAVFFAFAWTLKKYGKTSRRSYGKEENK